MKIKPDFTLTRYALRHRYKKFLIKLVKKPHWDYPWPRVAQHAGQVSYYHTYEEAFYARQAMEPDQLTTYIIVKLKITVIEDNSK